ncbi:acyl-CoA dehydrogenase [Aerosticca soli]|uniref:Acyl-CoA dehydrogenase/oxidase domain protein n=1 Tax=Aerosticca soli TaxID=2010829 RepID=A0A2Z6E7Z1_9GAMM|nr:acyl-CoA dehydrogenase [Aerosticca soli]BBD81167.1 acyl-CoA dehydrogenase/oxidase domain protein [Aerosticca soli]
MSELAMQASRYAARSSPTLRERAEHWLARLPSLPLPGSGRTLERWRALAAIAAEDVCLVKLLEAHYDALAILAELGVPPSGTQARSMFHAVWAAEPPQARLRFIATDGGHGMLDGRKAWCSGADLVDAALVTAYEGDARVLVQVRMDEPGIERSGDDWQALGMGRLYSGTVVFRQVCARRIGAPGAYLDRPGFWHGGAGIAACWFGAATAIAERLRRAPQVGVDPHALAHLGALDIQLAAAASLLRDTAAAIDAAPEASHREAVLRVRGCVEHVATEVIERVGRALGPAPLCADRDHAQRCADLAVFVRQSHAERDWAALGEAASARTRTWSL